MGQKLNTEIDDLIAAVATSADAPETIANLKTITSRMGFEMFGYYLLPSTRKFENSILFSTYPQAWAEQYKEEKIYLADPIVDAVSARSTPFLWSELQPDPAASPQIADFFTKARAAGVLMGGSIPLRGPDTSISSLSISTDDAPPLLEALWKKERHRLHILAAYVHEQLLSQLGLGRAFMDAELSVREKECLLWTAQGKSAWVIGEILSLSQFTVEEYLAQACVKLGVRKKVHAVALAIKHNLIAI